MNSILRSSLVVSAASLVLSSASLQAQVILEFGGQQVSTPWNPPGGATTRSACGRLDPGAVVDVALLCGATPVLLLDADVRDARVPLPLVASDLDVLPEGAPGDLDLLVSVGPDGVLGTWYDVGSGALVSQTLAQGDWVGARAVRALDADGDGLSDLVGLAADRTTLLVLTADGAPLQFSAAGGGTATAPVRDLCAVQWDGDAALELALLTDAGVEVLEADGTPRDQWPGLLPGGALARIGQDGQQIDRLVWITAYAPPAVQVLRVLAPGAVEESLHLGGLDVYAALGGDVDLDGDDDLLVSHRHSNELIWFENEREPGAPQAVRFATPNPRLTLLAVGPDGSSAALNQAVPACADLDGDGDLDVLFAATSNATLELMRGEQIDETQRAPRVLAGVWDPDASSLRLDLAPPVAGLGAGTHLRARVWRKAGTNAVFECEPVVDASLDLSAGWLASLELALPESEASFERVYSIELNVVSVQDGQEASAAPASIHYLVGDEVVATAVAGLPGFLGAKTVLTSGTETSESSNMSVLKKSRTGSFGSGFVPYL